MTKANRRPASLRGKSLAEFAASFRAAYSRGGPDATDDGRDAAVRECDRCMVAAAELPSRDHDEIGLKLEMVAADRDGGQSLAGEALLDSALADAERLSGRQWVRDPEPLPAR
jgi:hypothetical protein